MFYILKNLKKAVGILLKYCLNTHQISVNAEMIENGVFTFSSCMYIKLVQQKHINRFYNSLHQILCRLNSAHNIMYMSTYEW